MKLPAQIKPFSKSYKGEGRTTQEDLKKCLLKDKISKILWWRKWTMKQNPVQTDEVKENHITIYSKDHSSNMYN